MKEKRRIRYELILFYNMGFKPKDAIKKGYKPVTAYRYNRNFKNAKEKLMELMKK